MARNEAKYMRDRVSVDTLATLDGMFISILDHEANGTLSMLEAQGMMVLMAGAYRRRISILTMEALAETGNASSPEVARYRKFIQLIEGLCYGTI